VVADSIRRGEMSPAKERRIARRGGRKKHSSTTILDGTLRIPNGEGVDADGDSWDGLPRASTATAPPDALDGLATAPVSAGQPTPGEEPGVILRGNSDDLTTLSRLRSLSDSWSKSVPWLGAVLQKRKDSQTGADQSNAGEGSSDQNNQSQ
jgi:hypothetical protein